MSVYTQLSLAQAQQFATAYGLEVIALNPIQGGIQNTNYFLVCADQKQYVLTIFENETAQSAGELVPVLQQLQQHGVPVATPLLYQQQAIHTLLNKPAQIAPRVWGEHPMQTSLAQVIEIAKAQAKLHTALQHFKMIRSHDRGHAYWTNIGQILKTAEMNADDQQLFDQVYAKFEHLQTQHPDRPKGWIHSDLFRDNTLFQGDQLTGILDFFELNHDELLFDIAITINDFCTQYPDVTLNTQYVQAFLQAYQDVRPLTADEKACLNIYLAMAACRFWLLRLNVARLNRLEGRTGADVFVKDPAVMRAMLVDRLNAGMI
ncbi:homoserine kinase [Acinetobacter qingfengensis]|uniref:Homoserine kinase n=1 Tax=Acinetobacter qingfengensis TaxID=1262585 RepID=A0A1E7R368_9GAMM|nr:homoserine kinase [Acinetobacter qingfengensis]KAA8733777.1 homoserine kinase [Acinetobacter qingfengensis]OEY93712.1 homoserine kinase [Acinetobacter qingfengensis]